MRLHRTFRSHVRDERQKTAVSNDTELQVTTTESRRARFQPEAFGKERVHYVHLSVVSRSILPDSGEPIAMRSMEPE